MMFWFILLHTVNLYIYGRVFLQRKHSARAPELAHIDSPVSGWRRQGHTEGLLLESAGYEHASEVLPASIRWKCAKCEMCFSHDALLASGSHSHGFRCSLPLLHGPPPNWQTRNLVRARMEEKRGFFYVRLALRILSN